MTFSNELLLFRGLNVGYGLKRHPQEILVGNFNGDNYVDIIITDTYDNGTKLGNPTILFGIPNGLWMDGTSNVFGDRPPEIFHAPRIAVYDFNNDFVSDVYFPDFGFDGQPFGGYPDSYYLSNSDGLLIKSSVFSDQVNTLAHGFSVGDINSDGYLDIVVNNLSSFNGYKKSNFIFMNDGTGLFVENSENILPKILRSSNPNPPSHTWSGLIDINGDDELDLVLGTWDGAVFLEDPANVSSIFVINDGNGSYSSSEVFKLPKSPLFMEVIVDIDGIDLNNDGYNDLLISATTGDPDNFYKAGYLQILINNKDNTFRDETQTRLPQDPNAPGPWWKFVRLADLNADGALDLLLIASDGLEYNIAAKVYVNDGAGNFTEAYVMPTDLATDGGAIGLVDVNLDGKMDLVHLRHESPYASSVFALLNDLEVNTTGSQLKIDLFGTNGDDSITGNSADNIVEGFSCTDTVVFSGIRENYAIFSNSQGQTIVADVVANRDGKDTLQNVEFLLFGGQSISTANALVEPADADNSAFQVYRFYNSQTGSHFFTTSLAERNSVIEALDVMSYEGNAFDSNVTDVNGTAVFRFFNLGNNVHFYTANTDEAAGLRQNAGFRDEGISYYASDDDSNGGTALYRFFNTQNGSHFYTVSEAERDNIISTLGHYNYEGTAFYVDIA